MKVTEKCDVYSFGVVVLEIMMGKHPGDLLTSKQYLWSMEESESASDVILKDLLDERLPPPRGKLREAIGFIVKIGFACTRSNPELRPTMRSVATEVSVKVQTCNAESSGKINKSKLTGY